MKLLYYDLKKKIKKGFQVSPSSLGGKPIKPRRGGEGKGREKKKMLESEMEGTLKETCMKMSSIYP